MKEKYKEALKTIMDACKTVHHIYDDEKCPIFETYCKGFDNCPFAKQAIPECWDLSVWSKLDIEIAAMLIKLGGCTIKKYDESKYITVFDENNQKIATISVDKVFHGMENNKLIYLYDIKS